MEFFCIESFVPQDYLLRKIEEAVDFSKLYEIVGDLYCHNNGRPSVDPVVLFKIVFIQHLYGIPSLRRTCEEIKMNVAYRWFLGYLMNEQLPYICENCPSRERCTHSKSSQKVVTRHIWEDYM
ncbi:MAG TPA: hypothetical protein DCG49_10770, partial [Ruminococcus sp.]|nr:hypothetical protein [Ruminococcus sp.]